jgi:hypothetical protein
MTAWIVAAWACYAMAAKRPAWGVLAGVAAVLAWFTKAAAAFFVVALALDAGLTLLASRLPARRARAVRGEPAGADVRAAALTWLGLAAAFGAIGLFFVWPHWREYWFYNVQMSVQRKPSYDLASLIDRTTWIGVAQDVLTRMWPVLASAALAVAGVCSRWREAKPAERRLVFWVLLGLLELAVHDSGTERRYVMFVPAFIALASLLWGSGTRWISPRAASAPAWARLLVTPMLLALAYVVVASAVRTVLVVDLQALHPYRLAVRTAAVVAVLLVAGVWMRWSRVTNWLAARQTPAGWAVALVAIMVAWNVGLFARWAARRGDLNYQASVAVGRLLPPGTLVHGKLANGLALENRIRPVFVGRGFGNYADRFERDDARYILTYDLPQFGYESQPGLIQEILDRYPQAERLATFDVDETPGRDRAVLIDKHPERAAGAGPGRARD